jgi:hypothetical protein
MPAVSLVRDERYTSPRQVSIGYGHMTREGGERLRVLLETAMGGRHGWVTALAAAAQVRRATVYAWFAGTSEPRAESLRELARVTGLKRWQFLAAIDGDDVLDLNAPEGESRIRQIVDEQIARREGGQ